VYGIGIISREEIALEGDEQVRPSVGVVNPLRGRRGDGAVVRQERLDARIPVLEQVKYFHRNLHIDYALRVVYTVEHPALRIARAGV
jgi:hypothetical protein